MKKFLKILGIFTLVVIFAAYLAFLFVLPEVVDLAQFKPMVKELAKEQAKLDVDFDKVKISTTPTLGAGVYISDLSVKLPDKSELFSADSIKAHISLPSLFVLNVKITDSQIESPKINLDIENGKQYKVVKLVEEIVNSQKQDFTKVDSGAQPLPFDPSIIRITVPAFKIKDYKVAINDPKNNQNMVLDGAELVVGYFNGKVAKVKTDAKLSIDGNKKIAANVDVNTFIPSFPPALDEEDDKSQRLEIPFVNPIDIYKTYDLKSNINAKLKVRERKGSVALRGFFDVDDFTMTLSGYKLPESYAHFRFAGKKVQYDTNLYVNPSSNIQSNGKVGFGRHPFVDVNMLTSKIYFNDLIVLSRAVLDTLGVPNNLVQMKGLGYFEADAALKTNFKKFKSNGKFLVKNGGLSDKTAGLLIKDGNVDIDLSDNVFNIKQAVAMVNGTQIKAHGKIDEKAVSDLNVSTDKLSLKELYSAFAPADLKRQFAINSGYLSFDAQLQGELKKVRALADINLKNFILLQRANAFTLSNDDLNINIDSTFPKLDGAIVNKDFRFNIPATNSRVFLPLFIVSFDENNISILRSGLKINNSSVINFNGRVENYARRAFVDFVADGKISADDLKILAGRDAAFFLDGKGLIPLRVSAKGHLNKLALISQVMCDANNYFTPINFESLNNRQTILQAAVDYKGNRIRIKDTGVYVKNETTGFGEDLVANIANAKPVVAISSTITGLDSEPYINLFRISIPKPLSGSIYAFKNSAFTLDRTMIFAFGNALKPRVRGLLNVNNVSIPDLLLTMKNLKVDLREHRLGFNVRDLNVNDSDFNITGQVQLTALPMLSVSGLDITSNNIDIAKLTKVAEAAAKLVPASSSAPSSTAQNADLPVLVHSGSINFKRIDASPIVAENTTGRIALRNNEFFLNRLQTSALGGRIAGNINMNLQNSLLGIKVHGSNFDVEKALLVLANMQDAISGTASFDTDITINAAAPNEIEQMKSLRGAVDFEILDGQLGPFGRIENLILAENIRESKFFQTTIGSVVNSITTIESSHFQNLNGHLEFEDGIVNIKPITSIGKVLCLHIAGNMNLLTNDADMKLRARMGSQLSNMLGPLAAINPVNLIKVTPGLNVMAAKAFQFFCESITQAEMDALPDFKEKYSAMSTTKFQVVLRGNLEKPLSMIKSFKWLALDTDIAAAENFVSTLPDPSIVPDAETATYEQIMAAKIEQERLKAQEEAKPINRLKRFLNIDAEKDAL